MKRGYVKDHIDVGCEVFNGPLERVCHKLAEVKSELSEKGYRDIIFDWHSDYDYQVVRAHFHRLENNEEFERRKKKLEKKIRKMEEEKNKRHELYLQLKQEFEG